MHKEGNGMQRNVHAHIHQGEDGFYVAECVQIPVTSQGRTLDETMANLQEAVALHLEGEDLAALGLAPDPSLVVTLEVQPAAAHVA